MTAVGFDDSNRTILDFYFFSGEADNTFDERRGAGHGGMESYDIASLRRMEFIDQFVQQYPFIILKSVLHARSGNIIRPDH